MQFRGASTFTMLSSHHLHRVSNMFIFLEGHPVSTEHHGPSTPPPQPPAPRLLSGSMDLVTVRVSYSISPAVLLTLGVPESAWVYRVFTVINFWFSASSSSLASLWETCTTGSSRNRTTHWPQLIIPKDTSLTF